MRRGVYTVVFELLERAIENLWAVADVDARHNAAHPLGVVWTKRHLGGHQAIAEGINAKVLMRVIRWSILHPSMSTDIEAN